jgi:STE24 endopeptidase
MNPLGLVVLAALVLTFALRRLAEALNLSSASAAVPEDFKGFYDSQRYGRAQAYLKARTRFAGISSAVYLGATLAFWFWGGFGFLDEGVRSLALGPVLSGLIYVGALLAAQSLLAVPFQAYSVFVIEERFGFNRTSLGTFLADGIKALALSALIGAPLLAGVLALFEYAGPRAWWLVWALTVLVMVVIQFVAPRWILPLFNRFTPLEEGELRTAILAYARATRFPLENVVVMDGSRRSTKRNAFFTGFGRYRRIALFDTMIRAHTIPEIVAILAHETGHYRKRHLVKNMALGAAHSGAVFCAFSFALQSPSLFDAFAVEPPSVYTGLVLFALLLPPVDLALGVLLNLVSRAHERAADRFAVETTQDRSALVSALKKLAADSLSNLSPHPLHVALSYSHPPIQQRIRAIEAIPAAASLD